MNFIKNFFKQIERFFLTPASAIPLAVLRIGLGLCLLVQAYIMRTTVFDFFSSTGYIQGDLARVLNDPTLPQISWLMKIAGPLGANEKMVILTVCWFYVLSLIFLTIGFRTRFAAIFAWLLHWILMNTANSTTYGVDLYTHVFLFYFMWMPVGDALSWDVKRRGRWDLSSPQARLGLRVLQLHLCITYLASGIEKAQGSQWWNGELMWRALSLPIYKQYDMSWIVNWPVLSMLIGWSTLFLEIGYCIFIWPRATRKIWVAGIVGLHFGIIVLLGLNLFGSIMCLLTAAVFGFSAEPRRVS